VFLVELERDAQQLLEVRRHVLTHAAIAAGRSHLQHSVPVHQLDAGPVELGLHQEGKGALPVEHASDPFFEAPELIRVHGVVERQHWDPVGHAAEAFARWRAHPLGRGVGQAQIRMCGLQALKLPEQAIVLGVADLRRILEMVEPDVAIQLVDQPANALGGSALLADGHDFEPPTSWESARRPAGKSR
jgi:hypothetical protein